MADLKISQLTGATTPLAGTEVLPIVQSSTTKQVSVANLTAGRSVSAKFLTATGTHGGLYGLTVTNTTNNAPGFVQISGTGTNGGGEIDFINGASTGWGGIKCVEINKIEFLAGNYSTMVAINNGNIVPSTAAKGINFTANTPAAGMTSQLLNWYEEGTWTPTYTSLGASFTYTEQYGSYTRIGRLVIAQFRLLAATATGTTTNACNVTGLPFTSANLSSLSANGISIGLQTFPSILSATSNNNSKDITLWIAGTINQPTAANTVGAYLIGTATYFAA